MGEGSPDPRRRLPEYRLTAQPVTPEAERALGFRWADPKIGTRHKLGGQPDFQQPATVPHCPSCAEAMTFYGQLDSIGDDIVLADCGLIFVFVCFDCLESVSFVQSG